MRINHSELIFVVWALINQEVVCSGKIRVQKEMRQVDEVE